MSRKIFNKQNVGSYDFLTQLIEIDTGLFKKTTEQAGEIINTEEVEELEGNDLEIYKTYVHETTHFLDSTTTLWGLQYSIRLNRWFKYQNEQTLEVLAINDAEITLHNFDYDEGGEDDKFSKINYSLRYDEKIGVFIKICYLDEFGNLLYSSPLSMLALLEGHAYAKELLIPIENCKRQNDLVELSILKRTNKENILKLNSCEYITYLALAMQMMPKIDVDIHLNLLCKIFEFCLDIPSLYFAQVPSYLFEMAFENVDKELIAQLKMEFNRSQNRHVLALLILFDILNKIHNNIIILDCKFTENIDNLILEIFNYSNEPVEELLQSIKIHWQIELKLDIDILSSLDAKLPLLMAQQRIILGWGYESHTKYDLPDICVNEDELLSFNRRLDFDIKKHFYEVDEKNKVLKSEISSYGAQRQHPTPDFSYGFLEWMKEHPMGGIYYHNE
ncbi:hypothetical protein Q6344_06685 [Psychrobacter cibarius]|nr:hypothetical protein Q6344_06685 [Psychrobacter cibarius]